MSPGHPQPCPGGQGDLLMGVGRAEGAQGAKVEGSLRSHPPLAPPWEGGGKSESFADCAARLGGLAGLLLGWRPQDFWGATPVELAAVLSAGAPGEVTASSGDLARLMEMFPDD